MSKKLEFLENMKTTTALLAEIAPNADPVRREQKLRGALCLRDAKIGQLKRALSEARTQLWHAIEAGCYRDVPLQSAMERAKKQADSALK